MESNMTRQARREARGTTQGGWKRIIWIGLGIALLFLLGRVFFVSTAPSVSPREDFSGYQAVFLDTGQVYFGQLNTQDERFYVLTDVYYFKTSETQDTEAGLALTKLGNEAHDPTDEMRINVEHILFIESLREDSRVTIAIQAFQRQK